MFFRVSPEIFQDFSSIRIGIIICNDIDNSKVLESVSSLLKQQQAIIKKNLNLEKVRHHPHIVTWKNVYNKFGAKPKEHLSSVERLAKRVLKGEVLEPINTLVDLYNVISMKYLLPIGGQDLDSIQGDIFLKKAKENELPVLLLGEKEARQPKLGEVFYTDLNGAITRRLNWKEAERTKLTTKTKNSIIVLESIEPVEDQVLKAATYELADLIKKFCGGNVSVAFLDKANPEITIKKNNKYQIQQSQWKSFELPINIYDHKEESFEIDHTKHDSGEHEIRLEKLKKLKELGIDPWAPSKEVTATAEFVKKEFKDDGIEREYEIAGRVMSVRVHGKTAFADLQDMSGRIQIYLKKDIVGQDVFEFFEHFIDIGDIIWCKGHSFKTKMGEITLQVKEFTLLTKCLHPLPEKFHGISDIEIKYRQRYLDLIASSETRNRFIKRSLIIKALRHYLDGHGSRLEKLSL